MKKFSKQYSEEEIRNRVLQGNNYDLLDRLPEKYFHTCITSPPYWGLRDYKTTPLIWPSISSKNNLNCKHVFDKKIITRNGGKNNKNRPPNIRANKSLDKTDLRGKGISSQFCKKCGAWKGQLGLEPYPEIYIEHIVMICRKIWRVLRDDGTFWLNLGDSYWGSGGSSGHNENSTNMGRKTSSYGAFASGTITNKKHPYYKPKDLCLIPARIAIALQQDGWYLRSDIIWNKLNGMPESVTDRPTKNHEYIFLLTKSQKYYYDALAIREKLQSSPSDLKKMVEQKERIGGKTLTADDGLYKANMFTNIGQKRGVGNVLFGRNKRSVWTLPTVPFADAHFAVFPPDLVKPAILAGTSEHGCCAKCGKPYERIIEKIRLSDFFEKPEKKYRRREGENNLVPKNGNNITGSEPSEFTKYDTAKDSAGKIAAYRNKNRKAIGKLKIDTEMMFEGIELYDSKYFDSEHGQEVQGFIRSQTQVAERTASRIKAVEMFPDDPRAQQEFINYVHDSGAALEIKTLGWQKTCKCKTDEIAHCNVLDAFNGSGTTGEVARKAGRDYTGIELSASYLKISQKRIGNLLEQRDLF